MAKRNSVENTDVYTKVITTLVREAAATVAEVALVSSDEKSKQPQGVGVYFLQNEKIAVDLYVNVVISSSVPDVISQLQIVVKNKIEEATRYNVHSLNVQVVSVIFPSQN